MNVKWGADRSIYHLMLYSIVMRINTTRKTEIQHEVINHLSGNDPILGLLFDLSNLITEHLSCKIKTRERHPCNLCQPHTSSPED